MSTDNPYQSPQSSSTPEPSPDSDGRVHTKFPTWRFWVLAVACIPLFVVGYWVVDYVLQASGSRQTQLPYLLAYLAAIGVYLFACLSIVLLWRAIARHRSRLFLFGLTWLAIFAIPSAFMSLCTPAVAVTNSAVRVFSNSNAPQFYAGCVAGTIGAVLVILLARGTWLDARGRKLPKDANEQLIRPLPRIQARKSRPDID